MTSAAITTYPAYKASGVDWIGDIPQHWEQKPNKYVFKLNKKLVGKKAPEFTLLSLTLGGVIARDMENPEGKFPAEFDTYQEVNAGDFVFCHFDVEETPRTVGLTKIPGMITGAYTVYETVKTVVPGFLEYFYLNADQDKKLRSLYRGLRNTIPRESFSAFKTPLPPIEEQKAITTFLDKKTAQIAQAIQIKEEQITLLKERKQIIVQQAVTRGLNPNASMKGSGIDWIGEIPVHWEIRRGKFLFDESSERSERGNEELLSVSHTTGVTPRSEKKKVYMFLAEDYSGSKLCSSGDIVINTMWAWMGALGVSEFTGLVSPSYGVYRPKEDESFNGRYLEWLLRSTLYVERYNKISTGLHSSRLRLYPHMFLNMYIGFPGRKEQDQIVKHIERATSEIAAALVIKEQQIKTLKEYKTTLINAAVTGKIKVA